MRQAKSVERKDWRPDDLNLNLKAGEFVRGTGFRLGDVVGCLLDLQERVVQFTLNGKTVSGEIGIGDVSGVFFPIISMSAGIRYEIRNSGCISFEFSCFSCSFHFGPNLGEFLNSHSNPPEGYAGLYEAFEGTKVPITKCVSLGDAKVGLVKGLPALMDFSGYVPAPVDTSDVRAPVRREDHLTAFLLGRFTVVR